MRFLLVSAALLTATPVFADDPETAELALEEAYDAKTSAHSYQSDLDATENGVLSDWASADVYYNTFWKPLNGPSAEIENNLDAAHDVLTDDYPTHRAQGDSDVISGEVDYELAYDYFEEQDWQGTFLCRAEVRRCSPGS